MTITKELIHRYTEKYEYDMPEDLYLWLLARYNTEPYEEYYDEIDMWDFIRDSCLRFQRGELDISTDPYRILLLQHEDLKHALEELRHDIWKLEELNEEYRQKLKWRDCTRRY